MGIFGTLAKSIKRRQSSDNEGRGGRSRKGRSLLFEDDGDGVYISTKSTTTPPCSYWAMPSSSKSSSTSPSTISTVSSWKSSGSAEHQKGSPLLAIDPDCGDEPAVDEATRLSKIMARSRQLPGTWYYSSNHILVNQERKKRTIAPLIRMRELDELARAHAAEMAADRLMIHICPAAVTSALKDKTCRRLGSNVAKGQTIREIHANMMLFNPSHRNNILDRRFISFGMGTAVGTDGDLYLCQIFRG